MTPRRRRQGAPCEVYLCLLVIFVPKSTFRNAESGVGSEQTVEKVSQRRRGVSDVSAGTLARRTHDSTHFTTFLEGKGMTPESSCCLAETFLRKKNWHRWGRWNPRLTFPLACVAPGLRSQILAKWCKHRVVSADRT